MISSAREWRAGVEVRAELAVVILVERDVFCLHRKRRVFCY